MKRVLYPGSFDPITKGHMNIIEQATAIFDEVIVVVMKNANKSLGFFTIDERVSLIKELYKDNDKVSVIAGTGASVDIALLNDCCCIIRGLRTLSDYNFEVELQQFNKEISNNLVNTVCLFADKEYQFVSSSMVKEVFSLSKPINKYVDDLVISKMEEKTMSKI